MPGFTPCTLHQCLSRPHSLIDCTRFLPVLTYRYPSTALLTELHLLGRLICLIFISKLLTSSASMITFWLTTLVMRLSLLLTGLSLPPSSRLLLVIPKHTCRFCPVEPRLTANSGCRASKGSSALVGYAAIDGDNSWVTPLANYLSCDTSGANSGNTAIDLFGLNN